jgi:hypothetical protein
MSKKTQRKVSESVAPVEQKVQRASSRASLAVEFNPDYSEILKDLKTTGILAGVFISILVILSFFLR